MEIVPIPIQSYQTERSQILELIPQIWQDPESAANAVHSIERWGNNKNETGGYFYIVENGQVIGLTGYFKIPYQGYYGLRHHGTLVKGTGRKALDLLVEFLQQNFTDFEQIVELMPAGREDLVERFAEWGFRQIEDPDLSWEPKRDYYKVMMVRGVK